MQQELLHMTYNEYYELESCEFEFPQGLVIDGRFEKKDDEKHMAIRKLNFTLCIMLAIMIAITTISYYFATACEMTLNNLSRETMVLNDENVELENKLDNLCSFNNVDKSMQKSNLLSKAKQVIEVKEVDSKSLSNNQTNNGKVFSWAIGY